jgi:hypothetical protein
MPGRWKCVYTMLNVCLVLQRGAGGGAMHHMGGKGVYVVLKGLRMQWMADGVM